MSAERAPPRTLRGLSDPRRPAQPRRAAAHRHDPGDDGAAAAAVRCSTCCSPSTSRSR
ncbi:MAG: hypothetical protein MZW92_52290 [Comamonadaceae bacterium]|nr:hypothetical protein [Comamonadaceae bacterium]